MLALKECIFAATLVVFEEEVLSLKVLIFLRGGDHLVPSVLIPSGTSVVVQLDGYGLPLCPTNEGVSGRHMDGS